MSWTDMTAQLGSTLSLTTASAENTLFTNLNVYSMSAIGTLKNGTANQTHLEIHLFAINGNTDTSISKLHV